MFLPDDMFVPLPKLAIEPFLKLWEHEVFALLLAEGKINEEVVANMRSWKHSGFSVDQSVRLEAGERDGIRRLIQYFLRCPFSQARMIRLRPGRATARQVEVTRLRRGFGGQADEGKVLYKTGDNRMGRFPEAASHDLRPGPKRNFQIFDPLDFLAEVTQHIPEMGDHLIRYYGWYSNKKRGQRAKHQPPTPGGETAAPRAPNAREARKRWAALIKQVYETDPLACPKCGSTMKLIGCIEQHQSEVIEKILRHCGLWEEAPARAPPQDPEPTVG